MAHRKRLVCSRLLLVTGVVFGMVAPVFAEAQQIASPGNRGLRQSCSKAAAALRAHGESVSYTEIRIDATRRKAISAYVYGVNFPDWKRIPLPFPIARMGGNRLTAYNWETNASNAGSDWHHQNDDNMGASNEPGLAPREFLEAARSHNAAVIMTIPMAGYVAADKKGDGDVNQTPNYLETRFFKSLPKKSGAFQYPPDTSDKVVYQDEFVSWFQKIKGANETVWYALDNEPDIWAGTHARIVPKQPTYQAFLERSIAYASAIKDVAPKSLICGPVSYGWSGYETFQGAPDANGRNFLDFYLAGMRDAGKKQGRRLLDVLDLHYYPEARGGDVRVTDESPKPETAAARIQAPRSLWDDTYVETSWITQNLGNKPIALFPRIWKQIDANYPGTKFALTEYNFGGKKDISGTIAEADVLGLFGRYGLVAALCWGLDAEDTAQIAGFRAFMNYDGQGAKFGDQGLNVVGETASDNSIYASLDSKRRNRLTVVAINKTSSEKPMRFRFAGFAPRTVAAYTITQTSLAASLKIPANVAGNAVDFTAPAFSVTTLELGDR